MESKGESARVKQSLALKLFSIKRDKKLEIKKLFSQRFELNFHSESSNKSLKSRQLQTLLQNSMDKKKIKLSADLTNLPSSQGDRELYKSFRGLNLNSANQSFFLKKKLSHSFNSYHNEQNVSMNYSRKARKIATNMKSNYMMHRSLTTNSIGSSLLYDLKFLYDLRSNLEKESNTLIPTSTDFPTKVQKDDGISFERSTHSFISWKDTMSKKLKERLDFSSKYSENHSSQN